MGFGFDCCQTLPKSYNEHYIIEKRIGAGAFGEVFLIASDLTRKKYIAKIIHIKNPNKKNMEQAFIEAKILRECHHPNIIFFKEVFKQRVNDEVTLNIITEYADDGDLYKKAIEKKSKGEYFKETQLIYWLMQICLALKYLHEEKKIMHRDIKPSNIFLTKKGYVKLGDFGLSKIFDNDKEKNEKLKRAKSIKGTPLCFPPEYFTKQEYTEKVDIWALGVTFTYLMFFDFPFEHENRFILIKSISQYSIKEMNSPIYSEEFKDLIKSMLSEHENDRPTARKILESDFMQKKNG
jgi:NIMA (never in mitosis gene a)-related kinase